MFIWSLDLMARETSRLSGFLLTKIDCFSGQKGAHSVLKKPVEADTISEFVHTLESER